MQEFKLYKGKETFFFDEKNHAYWRLDKDDPKKDGTPKKKRVVGVTTVLGIIDKPALIPWAVGVTIEYLRKNISKITEDPKKLLTEAKLEAERIKQESADLGNEIHKWIELYIKGEKPEMPQEENIKRGVISFLEWESENKPEYLESEKVVYSRQYNYMGTLDVVAIIKGKTYVLDLKTGNAIYQEAHAQVAAYLKADMEERGTKYDGRIILRISKETEEEYLERMKDKAFYQKAPEKYPYKVFEAINLDEEGIKVHEDFEAFLAALKIYRWKK